MKVTDCCINVEVTNYCINVKETNYLYFLKFVLALCNIFHHVKIHLHVDHADCIEGTLPSALKKNEVAITVKKLCALLC